MILRLSVIYLQLVVWCAVLLTGSGSVQSSSANLRGNQKEQVVVIDMNVHERLVLFAVGEFTLDEGKTWINIATLEGGQWRPLYDLQLKLSQSASRGVFKDIAVEYIVPISSHTDDVVDANSSSNNAELIKHRALRTLEDKAASSPSRLHSTHAPLHSPTPLPTSAVTAALNKMNPEKDTELDKTDDSATSSLQLHGKQGSMTWRIPDLYLVGNFDTATFKSRINAGDQYCSAGVMQISGDVSNDYDSKVGFRVNQGVSGYSDQMKVGSALNKLGDGLCESGEDFLTRGVDLNCVALDEVNHTLFVGGNIDNRLWDSQRFVSAHHLVSYNTRTQTWKPLSGSPFLSADEGQVQGVEVLSLIWDSVSNILFIGGRFRIRHTVEYDLSPYARIYGFNATTFGIGNGYFARWNDGVGNGGYHAGLAIWTASAGIQPFPGGTGNSIMEAYIKHCKNISHQDIHDVSTLPEPVVVTSALDPQTGSLIIGGHFEMKLNANDIKDTTIRSQPLLMMWQKGWRFLMSPVERHGPNDEQSLFPSLESITTIDFASDNILRVAGQVIDVTWNDTVSWTTGSNPANSSYSAEPATFSRARSMIFELDLNDFIQAQLVSLTKEQLAKDASEHKSRSEESHHSSPSYAKHHNKDDERAKPWVPHWRVLPGFSGVMGPIHRIMRGIGDLENILVVSGNFIDGSSVRFLPLNRPDSVDNEFEQHTSINLNKNITVNETVGAGLASEDLIRSDIVKSPPKLQGVVYAARQVLVPWTEFHATVGPADKPSKPKNKDIEKQDSDSDINSEDNTKEDNVNSQQSSSIVVLIAVTAGVLLGIFFAFYVFGKSWYNSGYETINDGIDMIDGYGNREKDLRTAARGTRTTVETNPSVSKNGKNLENYNSSSGGDHLSSRAFRRIFNDAMRARHLPAHESLRQISPSDVRLVKVIGQGSFGRVYYGMHNNNKVAVKEFLFSQADVNSNKDVTRRDRLIEEIVGEAGIMACLRHPKIVQIYGCSITQQALWITSELCNVGSLRTLLSSSAGQRMTRFQDISLCVDIADGMQYLHSRTPPIIHRDLKAHNIFVHELAPGQFVCKIGDWGSARALAIEGGDKGMTKGVGTACWLAPEIIMHASYSKASDIYAFGIIIWEILIKTEVYPGLSAEQVIHKVATANLRPPIPDGVPLSSIMTACWQHRAANRPDFQTVLNNLSHVYTSMQGSSAGQGGGSRSKLPTGYPKTTESFIPAPKVWDDSDEVTSSNVETRRMAARDSSGRRLSEDDIQT